MSCLYCGGDNCGGSGGGPTMCNDHPDNRSPVSSKSPGRARRMSDSNGPYSTTLGHDGRRNVWDADGRHVRTEDD
jgi:hypothetical protein